jgi:DNA-binding response OmpR family regulator
MRKILVLEDEATIREFVVINLKRSGYTVVEAGNGEDALSLLAANPDIDIALCDIMLPGIDGFEVARTIRSSNQQIGIILLTAKTQETDKVTGFMSGADDYITKPFSPSELLARVDALYRRLSLSKRDENKTYVSGPFTVDLVSRTCTKNNVPIDLTQVEFMLIKTFMENKNVALSRAMLLDKVWGVGHSGEEKTVDVNMRRLRMKIEDDPSDPKYITTLWGFGYKWCEA